MDGLRNRGSESLSDCLRSRSDLKAESGSRTQVFWFHIPSFHCAHQVKIQRHKDLPEEFQFGGKLVFPTPQKLLQESSFFCNSTLLKLRHVLRINLQTQTKIRPHFVPSSSYWPTVVPCKTLSRWKPWTWALGGAFCHLFLQRFCFPRTAWKLWTPHF